MTVNRNEARRLYLRALDLISRLNLRLFAVEEADQLGLIEADERREMQVILNSATDTMSALARVDAVAQALVGLVDEAIRDALRDPTAVVSVPVDDIEEHEEEAYVHVLVLQSLAARLAAIYGLDVQEQDHGLTSPQVRLRMICQNIGDSLLFLMQKKMIETPKSEHHVKHVLFACIKAAFQDALPDGKVAFPSSLKGHVPDLSVPMIKACVETKVARSPSDLSNVVDGLLADMSTYGSTDYSTFFAVIYTSDSKLTQEFLDLVLEQRQTLLGLNPKYQWKWLLVRGPLAPASSRNGTAKALA